MVGSGKLSQWSSLVGWLVEKHSVSDLKVWRSWSLVIIGFLLLLSPFECTASSTPKLPPCDLLALYHTPSGLSVFRPSLDRWQSQWEGADPSRREERKVTRGYFAVGMLGMQIKQRGVAGPIFPSSFNCLRQHSCQSPVKPFYKAVRLRMVCRRVDLLVS